MTDLIARLDRPTRAAVVAEARRWVRVPTFHKGRSREGGVDCLGLVLVVGEATGAIPGGIVIPAYAKLPNPRVLIGAMDANMIRLADDEVGPGDVVGLAWGLAGHPMHLAIVADEKGRRMIVHADPYRRQVTYVGFAGPWAAAHEGCPAWRYPRMAV